MKILIDIGHPAHVHYFKNTIRILKKKNHKIFITARDKEVSLSLLNKFGFNFRCTGKNKTTLVGKAVSIFRNDYIIFKTAKKFKPDIFVGFFSPFAAHVGILLKKPVVGFNDTENARISIMFAKPFTETIVVPSCYFGAIPHKKKVEFNGYFELSYLRPNYFEPSPSIVSYLKLKKNEKYVILRFVSWKASHDIGHKGIDLEMKFKAVEEFSKYAKVFISSEKELPKELKKYQINIPPEKMHDALY